MVDDFFEGALDGCGAIAGIGMAIALGLLVAQLLFSPVFWVVAGVGLVGWLIHRAVGPRESGKEPETSIPRSHVQQAVAPPIPPYRPILPTAAAGTSRLPRAEIEAPRQETPPAPVPLEFGDGEPSVFWLPERGVPYRGHIAARKRIERLIQSMPRDGRFVALLVGREGTGRGTLARITAARIQDAQRERAQSVGRYFVLPARQFRTREGFAGFARSLEPRDIVYVEDVAALEEIAGAELLSKVFTNPADEQEGGGGEGKNGIVDPTVSWICCTATPERLGGPRDPLRRALRPEIRLRDPTPDVIAEILGDREMEIHPDAAYEIAERAAPHPARALAMYAEAREFALAEESHIILPGHVRDALEIMGVE